jgi:hypothetical protein
MKPVKTGFGFTGNEAVPAGLLFDEDEEKPMANKKPTKGLAAARNAAPKDVFCLMWIGSTTLGEVVAKLKEGGYSGNENSVKARAARIRKSKRQPLDLPHLEGEPNANKNWDKVVAALNERIYHEKKNEGIGTLADAELRVLLKERKK